MRIFLQLAANGDIEATLRSNVAPGDDPDKIPANMEEVTNEPLPPGVSDWLSIRGNWNRVTKTHTPLSPLSVSPKVALRAKSSDTWTIEDIADWLKG